MYLYKASSAPTGGSGTRQNQSFMSRTIGREIQNTSMSREQFKDVTSARLQMKGPKQAAAVERAEMTLLRSQIQAFPEALMENARSGYILQQNNRRKELQDYQCHMMGRLESILRMKMVENGVDYRKYRIGGSDKGTYGMNSANHFH